MAKGKGLEDIKEVKSVIRSDAANESLKTGKWRLLDVNVAQSYQCVQDHHPPVFMNSYEIIYTLGRYKD